MKKNQTIGLAAILCLVGLAIACSSSDGKSTSQQNGVSNEDISALPRAEDCPKTTLSVNETKNDGLKKYEGCLLSLRGKIWEVRGGDGVALIDISERTDYNHVLFIGGNFSGTTYYEIGRKVSDMKINGDYEKLPVAVFTGTVETVNGQASLKNCVLTETNK